MTKRRIRKAYSLFVVIAGGFAGHLIHRAARLLQRSAQFRNLIETGKAETEGFEVRNKAGDQLQRSMIFVVERDDAFFQTDDFREILLSAAADAETIVPACGIFHERFTGDRVRR